MTHLIMLDMIISKLQIQGFSHTRIEGVGGQGAGGDVLVTPTYVQYTTSAKLNRRQ